MNNREGQLTSCEEGRNAVYLMIQEVQEVENRCIARRREAEEFKNAKCNNR